MTQLPSAFTWLRRGLTETVTPKGRLRPNLHRLEAKDWIYFEPSSQHLHKKQEIFQSAEREKYLLQSPGSLGPQREVLEMLLAHLPRCYPQHFIVTGANATPEETVGPDTSVALKVADLDVTYRVGDFEHFPLELASRLVQDGAVDVLEDLVLVEDGTVIAGSVLFSFSRFHERFGMNMDQIHRKVQQYQRDLEKPVNKVFATLVPERPMWRSNWNISWSDDLLAGYNRYPHRNPGISADDRAALFEDLRQSIELKGLGDSAWLKVEYQTLRRLRQHPRCVLFTVRTFINTLKQLKGEPLAAKALLLNLDRLHPTEFKTYLGIDDDYLFHSLRRFVVECSNG